MILPQGYAARPATLGDLDALVELFHAWDVADFGEADPVREYLQDDLTSHFLDLERDTRLVLAGDGSPAAMAQVFAINPMSSIDVFVRVHPVHQGRGLGTACLLWTEDRARERLGDGGQTTRLWNETSSTDAAGRALQEAHGYVHVRTFWDMVAPLDPAAEPGPVPDSVAIRPSVRGGDDRVVYEIYDVAFREHFGYERIAFEDWWKEWGNSATYDPELTLLAFKGDRPAGAITALVVEGPGWIGDLGVLPDFRGRGIGEALLRHSFADLARRGYTEVRLGVDSENETGATRLYERVGMRARRSWLVHEKRLGAD